MKYIISSLLFLSSLFTLRGGVQSSQELFWLSNNTVYLISPIWSLNASKLANFNGSISATNVVTTNLVGVIVPSQIVGTLTNPINTLGTIISSGMYGLSFLTNSSGYSIAGLNDATNAATAFTNAIATTNLVLSPNNNTFLGNGAGQDCTSGSDNEGVGYQALFHDTTGYDNTANGTWALFSNTTGYENTANGVNALYFNTTGSDNTANGVDALYSNTTGNWNTANGVDALYFNTTGYENTANGYDALFSNTTGYKNTANSEAALYSNTTGYENTANGWEALYSNTTGSDNTANGTWALFSNTTGIHNTANGWEALWSNMTGYENTADGVNALFSNTTGNDNTANGVDALYFNTTGSDNSANGVNALFSNTTGNWNTANGYEALFSNTNGTGNLGLGTKAGYYGTNFNYNIVIGHNAGTNMFGSQNIILGAFTDPSLPTANNEFDVAGAFRIKGLYSGTVNSSTMVSGAAATIGGSLAVMCMSNRPPVNIWTNMAATTTYWTNNYSVGQVLVSGGITSSLAVNVDSASVNNLPYTSATPVWTPVPVGGFIRIDYTVAPSMIFLAQ